MRSSRLSEPVLPLHILSGRVLPRAARRFPEEYHRPVAGPRGSTETTIVNPACVFGRHACDLASRLPRVRVIATDIDPRWERLYRLVRGRRIPDNYSFVKDNIFTPHLDVQPTAVAFFGACGTVSDGALDYAIDSRATHLMCRNCCHDNIGGNVATTKRSSNVNRFFRFKNWTFSRMRRKATYTGYYFSEKYTRTPIREVRPPRV